MKTLQAWMLGMTIGAVMLTTVAPSTSSAAVVVVPNAQASVEGTGGSPNDKSSPFNCNFVGFSAQRVQQVYLGSEVGSGQITQIAFRPNGVNESTGGSDVGTAFGPTAINMTIKMSTTSAAPDGLVDTSDAMMDTNVGADVVTVFNGIAMLQSAATGGPPRNFDIIIPLTTPFTFDSTAGNLLLEVTIPTCTQADTTFFDIQETTGDSVSRANHFGPMPYDLFFSETAGLVTQFTIQQADLDVSKSASPDHVTISGSNITFQIFLTNNGPDAAVNVVLTDNVPAHTTFQSLSVPAGFMCTTPAVGGTGTITCTAPTLAAHATVQFTLVVRLNPGTPRGTRISNTVNVTSDTFDPDTSNNSATATALFAETAPAMSAIGLVLCAALLMAGGMWVRSRRSRA